MVSFASNKKCTLWAKTITHFVSAVMIFISHLLYLLFCITLAFSKIFCVIFMWRRQGMSYFCIHGENKILPQSRHSTGEALVSVCRKRNACRHVPWLCHLCQHSYQQDQWDNLALSCLRKHVFTTNHISDFPEPWEKWLKWRERRTLHQSRI